MLKQTTKKLLHKIGLDIRKFDPTHDIFSWLKHYQITTVLDIGANVGQFAHEIREALPEAQIISFEPLKECYENLITSFSGDSRFKAFNMALGSADSTERMNKSAYTPSSSILPMAQLHKELFPHTKDQTPETITVRKLDDVIKKENLSNSLLIKIDVQGYEDKVIAGGTDTFKKARVALIETSFFPLYVGQPLFSDIYATMTSLGFHYHSSIHQKKDKKTGEILFEDSIFIR
ncbi:MAG: FkbM family methyltransferase [Patescibacteria group bacterium]